MKKTKELQTGDVFSFKTDNSGVFIYGRVLFDTQKQFTDEGMPFNYLDWHGKSVLIETYKYVSMEEEVINIDNLEVAIRSTFIDKKNLQKRISSVIANIDVDFKKVTFPETLKNVHREGILFTLGELAIKTNLTSIDIDRINVYPTFGNIYILELATLVYSERSNLIEDKSDIFDYFVGSDLRCKQDNRKEVYAHIGENPDMSYYELSLKYGFDFGRFYK
jgi:hypothetical protein